MDRVTGAGYRLEFLGHLSRIQGTGVTGGYRRHPGAGRMLEGEDSEVHRGQMTARHRRAENHWGTQWGGQ